MKSNERKLSTVCRSVNFVGLSTTQHEIFMCNCDSKFRFDALCKCSLFVICMVSTPSFVIGPDERRKMTLFFIHFIFECTVSNFETKEDKPKYNTLCEQTMTNCTYTIY